MVRGLIRSLVRWNRIPWFNLNVTTKVVPSISNNHIRDADVVIANHWQTVRSVFDLSEKKGEKINFIRNPAIDLRNKLLIESLMIPMKRVACGSWIKEKLESELGLDVHQVITNGLNMEDFGVATKKENDSIIVTAQYTAGNPLKGWDDAEKALSEVKKIHPEIDIHLFGWPRKPKNLPFEATYIRKPVKNLLSQIYAYSDIFLAPSLFEGYHNPPREAMGSQCALVATNVGSIPHCTIPGETAMVVEPGDIEAMVNSICYLIENHAERRQMGARAHRHMFQFDWEDSVNKLLGSFSQNS